MTAEPAAPSEGEPEAVAAQPARVTPSAPPLSNAWATVAADTLALTLLAALAVVFYRALLFSDAIASDPLLMRVVYPSRQFLAEALRDGRLPLWNPYLFTGVPFLADPASAALYPPQLVLRWLDAPAALKASLLAHTLLAAAGMYAFSRAVARTGAVGGFVGAAVFAFGGALGANAVEPNLVEAAAWLPWALLGGGLALRRPLAGTLLAAVALALQALAGSPFTTLLTLIALLLWLAVAALAPLSSASPGGRVALLESLQRGGERTLRSLAGAAGALALAGGLAAALLLPAWELFQRSARAEGLPYGEAVAGALPAEALVRALLPGFNEDPERAFIAHVGLVALGLALVGLRRRPALAVFAALCAGAGLTLALGDALPLYRWLFERIEPLRWFDRPARAMLLVTFAVAVASAVGLDELWPRAARRWPTSRRAGQIASAALGVALLLVAVLLFAHRDRLALPSDGVRQIWLGLAVVALDAAVVLPLLRPRRPLALLVAGAVAAELLIAGAQLPFTFTSPAAVFQVEGGLAAAANGGGEPARAGRTRSVAEAPLLPAPGFERYSEGRAGRDRLAPNGTMLDRLATVEGVPSALLPPRELADVLSGLAAGPAGEMTLGVLPDDGRSLLGPLLGAGVVAAPPRRPLVVGDASFLLTEPRELPPGGTLLVPLTGEQPATVLALLTTLSGGPVAGEPAAEVVLSEANAPDRRRTLIAGADTAEPGANAGQTVALPARGSAFYSEQPLGRAARFRSVTIRNVTTNGTLRVLGLSLVDDRSGGSTSVPLAFLPRALTASDPTLYEETRLPGRLSLVRRYRVEPDAAATRRRFAELAPTVVTLDQPPAPPSQRGGVVTGWGSACGDGSFATSSCTAEPAARDQLRLSGAAPERLAAQLTVSEPALLVLRDALYPGWQARLDGEPVALLRADGLFRAVAVPAGSHLVVFEFRPASLRRGVTITAVAGALTLMLATAAGTRAWWRGRRPERAEHDE